MDRHERELNDKKHKLQSSDIYTILKRIHTTTNADIMTLIDDIRKSIPSSDYISNSTRKKITFTSADNKNIHFEYTKETNTGFIYLNASTAFFNEQIMSTDDQTVICFFVCSTNQHDQKLNMTNAEDKYYRFTTVERLKTNTIALQQQKC